MLSQLVQPTNSQKQAKYSKNECLSTEFSAGFNIFHGRAFCKIWKVSQGVLTPGDLNRARENVWPPKFFLTSVIALYHARARFI